MNQQQYNKLCMSLAYKLIDTFDNLTLFGGIVRDMIVPMWKKGKFPFAKDEELPNREIHDIDIYVSKSVEEKEFVDEDEDDVRGRLERRRLVILHNWFFSSAKKKLREWDWILKDDIVDLNLYRTSGVRVVLQHAVFDNNEIQIDFIFETNGLDPDFDVNQFRFNKSTGLTFGRVRNQENIYSHFKKQKQMIEMIDKAVNKECLMVASLLRSNQSDSLILIKRFTKMLKYGWDIKNKSQDIQVRDGFPEDNLCCMVCYMEKEGKCIELTCSKCWICFDCFEQLFDKYGIIKCPNCRHVIKPWKRH